MGPKVSPKVGKPQPKTKSSQSSFSPPAEQPLPLPLFDQGNLPRQPSPVPSPIVMAGQANFPGRLRFQGVSAEWLERYKPDLSTVGEITTSSSGTYPLEGLDRSPRPGSLLARLDQLDKPQEAGKEERKSERSESSLDAGITTLETRAKTRTENLEVNLPLLDARLPSNSAGSRRVECRDSGDVRLPSNSAGSRRVECRDSGDVRLPSNSAGSRGVECRDSGDVRLNAMASASRGVESGDEMDILEGSWWQEEESDALNPRVVRSSGAECSENEMNTFDSWGEEPDISKPTRAANKQTSTVKSELSEPRLVFFPPLQ